MVKHIILWTLNPELSDNEKKVQLGTDLNCIPQRGHDTGIRSICAIYHQSQ